MDDCSRYLGSWIAVRLQDESKWIGVLRDINLENSTIVLHKSKHAKARAVERVIANAQPLQLSLLAHSAPGGNGVGRISA